MTKKARQRSTGPLYRPYAAVAPLLLLSVLGGAVAGCGGRDDDRPQPTPNVETAEPSLPRAAGAVDSVLAVTADTAAAVREVPLTEAPQPAAVPPDTVPRRPAPASPAPRPSTAEPVPFAAGTRDLGPYCLQVGAFRNPAYAEERYLSLATRGLHAVIETATVDGVLYHRVCVPNLPDRSAARRLGDTLAAEHGFAYLIRKE